MDKDLYQLLNDVEIDLDEYEKEEFTQLEEKQVMNRFKKSINSGMQVQKNNKRKSYLAAASALILALGTVGVLPTVASTNPMAHKLTDLLGIQKELDPYAQVINQGITKGGITIELSEVVVDRESKELVVSSRVITNQPMSELVDTDLVITNHVHIDGKEINEGASAKVKVIDEYTAEVVEIFYIDEEIAAGLDGDVDVRVRFATAQNTGAKELNKWIFEFNANGDELNQNTVVIPIGEEFTLSNGEQVIMERYVSNPLGESIYYVTNDLLDRYLLRLQGEDDLGNKVMFWNNRGNSGEGGEFALDYNDSIIDENATGLHLQLYVLELPEEDGPILGEYEPVGEKFTIKLK